jgi:hypothetical protein
VTAQCEAGLYIIAPTFDPSLQELRMPQPLDRTQGAEGRLRGRLVRRLVYSVRESPFNLIHHSASMQALPNGDGVTRCVWVTDVKPDNAIPGDLFDAAVASIQEALRS